MSKSAPECLFVAPLSSNQKGGFTFACEVVTPMLGGGAEPRTPHAADSGFRIRPPSIRGHLRFWWRAVCGSRHTVVPSKLRELEAALWGSTSQASRVRLRVDNDNPGRTLTQQEQNTLPAATPIYPIQNADRGKVIVAMRFRVTLRLSRSLDQLDSSFEEEFRDLQRTAFAWTHFGGIGCRTRRGMGALVCSDFQQRDYQLSLRPDTPGGDPRFFLPVWGDLRTAREGCLRRGETHHC